MDMNVDPNWLRKMAEKEDGGIISVGGLVTTISHSERIAELQKENYTLKEALGKCGKQFNLISSLSRGVAWKVQNEVTGEYEPTPKWKIVNSEASAGALHAFQVLAAVTTDPAEGCRQVIRTAQDALEGKEGES